MDGITGALIVRDVDDPSRRHYDEDVPEHVVLLHDWLHQYMAERVPGPRRLPRRGQLPDALLINGRGSRLVKFQFMHIQRDNENKKYMHF